MKRVGVAGGPSVTICPIDTYYTGASWGENNTIVFAEGALGMFRVQSSGGAAERLFLPDAAKGEHGYARPLVLPGGESILYTMVLAGGPTRILGRRIGASDSTLVVEGGFGPEYASRRLVFGQADRVMASDFDVATLRVIGSPVAIASGVFNKPANGVANVSMTSDGTAVYVSGHEAPMRNRLVWVDRSGAHLPITGELEYPRFVRLSPDDRRVAVTIGPPAQGQIWVYDLSGATQPTRLTIKDHNLFPTWSPDGKQIAFLSRVGETNHAMVIPSDGSTVQGMPMLKGGGFGVPMAWSPNGEFLLYLKPEKAKLWLLALRDKTERQWLETPFSELGSRFSPDGRWVVFASDQTGASEVWVRPFPGPGAPVRISPDGGQKPLWSKDGKEILYENAGKLWSTGIAIQQSEVRAQPPRVLLEQGFVHDDTDPNMRYLDIARDGRLLVVEPNQAVSDAAIVVAQHWDADLTRK